ncbi:hypothetical protein FB451DRAFT_1185730 [Mycena latifolia]|nr:hypothetical protein FB451DRAFT_1185730 [Mycena latifolia]
MTPSESLLSQCGEDSFRFTQVRTRNQIWGPIRILRAGRGSVDWNIEAAPADATYGTLYVSVEWRRFGANRVLVSGGKSNQHAAPVARWDVGIPGCTVPPGRKVFYILAYNPSLEMNMLQRITDNFPSIRDFHLNWRKFEKENVSPVVNASFVPQHIS